MLKLDKVKTVADALYEKSLITSDQLSAIKFENVNTGKSIEQVIKDRGYVSSEDFAEAFGAVYGIPYATLTPSDVDPKILDSISLDVARKNKIAPFKLDGDTLSLAMVDPLDLQTIDFVERKTKYKVAPFITTEKAIDRVLEEQKGKELGEEITAAMQEISQTTLKIEEGHQELTDATIRDAPIARIVGMILETAVKTGASDVHLEPGEEDSRLRYRIDGILQEKRKLPKEMHDSVVARIKILA
ncbi:MAG: ATPase, T2SS/T4P/T4SS family, partial [Patescibacteria group bacterium]